MVDYYFRRINSIILSKKEIKSPRLLILGVTFKKNIDDIRNSKSISLINKLYKRWELVSVEDPFIDTGKIFSWNSEYSSNNKEKYAGNDEGWNFTEEVLRKVATEKKLDFTEEKGEAAFYGPKLDFKVKDALGRLWQCSTLQFDFNLPERFDLTFMNSKSEQERPYMLHRALFGSFERFIGVLIEHYAGALPAWLSPVQVKIIPVAERHIEYCQKLSDEFIQEEIRVELDLSGETVGNRIRKVSQEKIPYVLVIGDKEIESNKLNVRDRGSLNIREVNKDDFMFEIKGLSVGK
jgi:threonyl-tRNA synthetase